MKNPIVAFLCLVGISWSADHIHFGSTNNPLNGLTITWHSVTANDSVRWGYTGLYESGKFSGTRRNDYSGYLYDYAFPFLNPACTLHYSIYSGTWGGDKTFFTSVDTLSPRFTFIAGGDSRTNLTQWQSIANLLAGERADLHLFLGDHVNSGSTTSDWDAWYSYGNNFIEKNLCYHTGGNHEYGSIYLNQFVMPGNESWYSFEFGNTLFICLLSEANQAAQHPWLVSRLQNSSKTWKVLFFHRPFFVTANHVGEMDAYLGTWWKAFDDYGVDVVLNGHTHYYMRTKPINRNVSTTAPVREYGSDSGQGRLEVVAGSYGAPLYATAPGWFVEKNVSIENYSRFRINGDTLHMNSFDINGNLIDSLTIAKSAAAIATSPAWPNRNPALNVRPNPFNAFVDITAPADQISHAAPLQWAVYDLSGRRVEDLTSQAKNNQVTWNTKNQKSGVYFIKVRMGDNNLVSKCVLIK